MTTLDYILLALIVLTSVVAIGRAFWNCGKE